MVNFLLRQIESLNWTAQGVKLDGSKNPIPVAREWKVVRAKTSQSSKSDEVVQRFERMIWKFLMIATDSLKNFI